MDFFVNVTHIQIHRRRRALTNLRAKVEAGEKIDTPALTQIILPIITHIIYDHASLRENPSEAAVKRKVRMDNDASVVDEAIILLGTVSRLLAWNQYYELLASFIVQMIRKPVIEKVLVRTVCRLLDQFHFKIP